MGEIPKKSEELAEEQKVERRKQAKKIFNDSIENVGATDDLKDAMVKFLETFPIKEKYTKHRMDDFKSSDIFIMTNLMADFYGWDVDADFLKRYQEFEIEDKKDIAPELFEIMFETLDPEGKDEKLQKLRETVMDALPLTKEEKQMLEDDRTVHELQIEELGIKINAAIKASNERLDKLDSIHQRKLMDASKAYQIVEKAADLLENRKSALNSTLQLQGYRSREAAEVSNFFNYDENGSLKIGTTPSYHRRLNEDTKKKMADALYSAENDYEVALLAYNEAVQYAEKCADEEEQANQDIIDAEKEEDEKIAELEKAFAKRKKAFKAA